MAITVVGGFGVFSIMEKMDILDVAVQKSVLFDAKVKKALDYQEDVRIVSENSRLIETALFNHIVLPKFWKNLEGLEEDKNP